MFDFLQKFESHLAHNVEVLHSMEFLKLHVQNKKLPFEMIVRKEGDVSNLQRSIIGAALIPMLAAKKHISQSQLDINLAHAPLLYVSWHNC